MSRFADGKWTQFTTHQGLPNDNVRAIVEAPDGALWIGTDGGLAHYAGGVFRRYGVADGLTNDAIYSLLLDREGVLWVSTLGGGLHRFQNGSFTAFTTQQGLFDSIIFQILDDDSGHLWMSSNRGVYRVAKSDLDAVGAPPVAHDPVAALRHGRRDGVERVQRRQSAGGNSDARRAALVSDAEGRRRRRSRSGSRPTPCRHPSSSKRSSSTSGGSIRTASAAATPGPGSLEFHYAGLSFLAPQKVRFRYRLEGFDKEWVDAGTRRAAYYTNTPPGHYRFHVIACNNDGVWNDKGATFEFALAPHIYQTRWFFSICVGVLLFLATGLYRLRVQGLTRRKAELVRLVGERTRQLEEANQRLEHANRALRRLSSQDGLTGIANRRQFDEVLDLEWRRAHRAEAPISLLMIDIDHFKAFNDAHGHQRGDDYLKAVAAALRDGLNRPGDVVARYGGEEFVVILPATDDAGANACAERLRSSVLALEIPHDRPGAPLSATVSIGVATAFPREGSSSATLIAAADEALYRAKSEGRNRVRIAQTVAV